MLLMWPLGYPKAAELETAPLASAQEILGTAASGSNYRVADPVASDGLLRIYSLQTSYGTFTTQGDAMLLQRRKELAALAALEAQSTSKAFGNAMAKAATAPIELAGDLVTKPVETVGRTISGIGEIFGRVASGVANVGRGRDDVASSALGISAAKRKIAAELGVDPYTDFAPLAKKLDEFARATAIGGLTVKIGFAFIPGAAGSAVSTSSTAHGLGKLVQDKTPAQLLDINRASLGRLGIPRDVAGRFLSNQNYTPADQTTIVSALQRLRGVKDLRLYADRLAQANRRDLAVFLRTRTEMIAAYQQRSGAVTRFVSIRGIPLTEQRDRSLMFLAPLDLVAWNAMVSKAFANVTADIRKRGMKGALSLTITGAATPVATSELKQIGWTVRSGT